MDYSVLLGIHFIDGKDSVEEMINDNILDLEELGKRSRMFISPNGNEIYFFGVIDVLQQWTTHKKLEKFFKVYFLRKDKNGVSCQPPEFYSDRFIKAIDELII